MGTYTVFFIGFFAGTAAGAGLVYWLAHDYLSKMIDTRTTAALDSVYKERDVIFKKAREDAARIQVSLEKAKQNLADKIAGK